MNGFAFLIWIYKTHRNQGNETNTILMAFFLTILSTQSIFENAVLKLIYQEGKTTRTYCNHLKKFYFTSK